MQSPIVCSNNAFSALDKSRTATLALFALPFVDRRSFNLESRVPCRLRYIFSAHCSSGSQIGSSKHYLLILHICCSYCINAARVEHHAKYTTAIPQAQHFCGSKFSFMYKFTCKMGYAWGSHSNSSTSIQLIGGDMHLVRPSTTIST